MFCDWRGFCVACQKVLGVGGGEPLALLGDADGDDFVFCLVDGFEDGGGGEEGDLVLAGAAAEEDADAEFLGGGLGGLLFGFFFCFVMDRYKFLLNLGGSAGKKIVGIEVVFCRGFC